MEITRGNMTKKFSCEKVSASKNSGKVFMEKKELFDNFLTSKENDNYFEDFLIITG